MFEYVWAILEKGTKEDVDVSVAREMVAVADEGHRKEIEAAGAFIIENYDAVTECYRLGAKNALKALCENNG